MFGNCSLAGMNLLNFVGLIFQKIGPKMLDHEGKEVPGNRGYKWVKGTAHNKILRC